jgi:hypothetical protein
VSLEAVGLEDPPGRLGDHRARVTEQHAWASLVDAWIGA